MKIKLSYFLGKRGTTLGDLCRSYSIKNHDQLCGFLRENRVEEPNRKDTLNIFKEMIKVKKNVSTEASRPTKQENKIKNYKVSKKGQKNLASSND